MYNKQALQCTQKNTEMVPFLMADHTLLQKLKE